MNAVELCKWASNTEKIKMFAGHIQRIRINGTVVATVALVLQAQHEARAQCDPPEPASLTLLSPLAGEVYAPRGGVPISWTTTGPIVGNIGVAVSYDGGGAWYGGLAAPYSDGGAVWYPTPCTNSTEVLVRISAYDVCNRLFVDTSGEFSIVDPGGLTVVSPMGGEALLVGETMQIQWTLSSDVYFSLFIGYSIDGGSWQTITQEPNDGAFEWTVPETPTPQARILLIGQNSCFQGPAIWAVSGTFSIVTTCDDGVDCTFDEVVDGQCVHIPFMCDDCLPCDPALPPPARCWPGLECIDGCCVFRTGVCPPPTPCRFTYYDPYFPPNGRCLSFDLCDENDPDLMGSIISAFEGHVLNGVFDAGVGQLFTASLGIAFSQFALPAAARFIAFEYKLLEPGSDETANLGFGDRLLWQTSAPTPEGEWVQELAYIGDVAGQSDTLAFALIPGAVNPPSDAFWFRNVRLYGPGRASASGDLDVDGDVDLSDWDGFIACLTGPGGGVLPGCQLADFEGDADVDLGDIAGFQGTFPP